MTRATTTSTLSSLLGELAVAREALEDYASRCLDCSGDGIRRGPEGDPEQCQWCYAAHSALSSDAGRLAGEVLRAAVRWSTDWESTEAQVNDQLHRSVGALLAAVPLLREEVGSG